jgi:hypothetical protein
MPRNIGPGSYDYQDAFNKIVKKPCQVIVKPLHNMQKESGEGQTYFMEGGGIMKDPHAPKIFGKSLTTFKASPKACPR